MEYDRRYARTEHLFGKSAEPVLVARLRELDPTLAVLDVGAGQGRNALYLARAGFTVEAIDPSAVAVQTLREAAQRESLSLRSRVCGFAQHRAASESYGTILVFGLLPILRWDEIEELSTRIQRWCRPGGLIFLTAFTIGDASYPSCAAGWQPVGENSFEDPSGRIRTFLEPGQLPSLLAGYELLHHWEGVGPEHHHGASPPERHAMVEAVFRRPEGGSPGL